MVFEFIPPIVAGIGLIIVALSLIFKHRLGSMIGGIGRPLGINKFWTLLILGVILFMAGGWTWISTSIPAFDVATITGAQEGVAMSNLDCKFVDAVSGATAVSTGNTSISSYSADSYDEAHYTAYLSNGTNMGVGYLVGNLTCERSGNYDREEAFDCWVECDTYRSDTSTTDTNTYTICETTNKVSYVDGLDDRQTAYIEDNAGAETTSSVERKKIVFADGDAEQKIGFQFKLSGNTNFNYLLADTEGGTAPSVRVFCENKQQGYVTIVKQEYDYA